MGPPDIPSQRGVKIIRVHEDTHENDIIKPIIVHSGYMLTKHLKLYTPITEDLRLGLVLSQQGIVTADAGVKALMSLSHLEGC